MNWICPHGVNVFIMKDWANHGVDSLSEVEVRTYQWRVNLLVLTDYQLLIGDRQGISVG